MQVILTLQVRVGIVELTKHNPLRHNYRAEQLHQHRRINGHTLILQHNTTQLGQCC